MNQIILVSHGDLAKGMKDTLNMIVGDMNSVQAFSSYREEKENIKTIVEREVKKHYEINEIYILTDIFGGSVNNEMISLLKDYPKVNIISGMNLPLVISIATGSEISYELLEVYINESKQSIINCTELLKKEINRKDDNL